MPAKELLAMSACFLQPLAEDRNGRAFEDCMETRVAGEAREAERSRRSMSPAERAGEGAPFGEQRRQKDFASGSVTCALSCPACRHITTHRFLYRKNNCEIFRCEECGLGRTETDDFDPEHYYTADYFSGKRSDGYADYLGAETVLRREFAQTVEFIRKLRSSGRLLEVGCAYGFLLEEAKRAFDVTGIELAEEAADHCRRSGLHVLTGAVDDRLLEELGLFDVIVMLDVIEHLPSPRQTVALLAGHLRPGGIIVITTGDFGALSARLAGARWRLMTPPQHLWFFSQEGMRRMASSIGLKAEYVDHPWKTVPLSLISFQLARMIGFEPRRILPWDQLGIPLNLFDAMRVVLRKEGP
jgi:SAM-dependent methyltransferase